MEITGKILIDLGELSGVSKAGNPWKKHEWVLETIGTNYPKKVKFTLFGDRADHYPLTVGENYTVQYEIESREFNGRWYTDINAISAAPAVTIAPAAPAAPAPQYGAAPAPAPQYGAAPAAAPFNAAPAPAFPEPDGSDDLPF